MKHNIVPLTELAEHTDRVRLLDIELPGLKVETLGVDVNRLDKAMKWGGIRQLSIGSYEGEGTEYAAGGFIVNPDGSLGAASSKIAKKATFADVASGHLHTMADYNWRNTAVYLNTTALKEGPELGTDAKVISLDKAFRRVLANDIALNELGPERALKHVAIAAGFAVLTKSALEIAAAVGLPHEMRGGLIGLDPSKNIEDAFTLYVAPILVLPGFQYLQDLLLRNPGGDLRPKYSTMIGFKLDRAVMAGRHLARPIITNYFE